jgi:hypothetical protein
MKTMLLCLVVPAVFGFARCAKAAPDVTVTQAAYCEAYAEREYQSHGQDDAFFEGAAEECEVQWMALSAQWDDPENLDRAAELGLRGGAPLPYVKAASLASALGRYGVDRVADGWLPTTAAEDAAADQAVQ